MGVHARDPINLLIFGGRLNIWCQLRGEKTYNLVENLTYFAPSDVIKLI